ncbi:MAG TPA: MFS transporter, partial [Blastocatellia bacterium]|nr:MFS transporter [Blastocatellia bacterium]
RLSELFIPEYRKVTIISAAMFACSLGAAFGAIQQIPQIVPALVKVDSLLPPQARQQIISSAVGKTQFFQEIGGLVGRFLLAFLAIRILSRRNLLRVFLVPGLILIPLVFIFPGTSNLQLLQWGMFIAGLFTVAQLSFWGNYLPRVYPTHLRGTGESFAANIGGRMIGASAPLLTTQFAALAAGGTPATRLAYAAAGVAVLVYAAILILSFFLPEPKQEELPE